MPRDGLTFSELQELIDAPQLGYYVKGPISEGTFQFMLNCGWEATSNDFGVSSDRPAIPLS